MYVCLCVAEFGLACHLGVLSDLPCVGVAKNLLQVQGVAKTDEHLSQVVCGAVRCVCELGSVLCALVSSMLLLSGQKPRQPSLMLDERVLLAISVLVHPKGVRWG